MGETPNHGYAQPQKGDKNWHDPLNKNFADIDADIELRDSGPPTSNDYTPTEGAKYLDTDSGVVYTADGNAWSAAFAVGRYTPPGSDPNATLAGSVVFGFPTNSVGSGVSGATISGGGRALTGVSTQPQPNEVTADYGTVGGGFNNVAGGSATVGGGASNAADELRATVGGGVANLATGESATVGGGEQNEAQAAYATIAGGGPVDTDDPDITNNVVYDNYGTIGGGGNNQAGSDDGDEQTTDNAEYATVGGGDSNTASGLVATVGGGFRNTASGNNATVGGGDRNTASGSFSTVGGGIENTASDGTVGGGIRNTADGLGATVPGGEKGAAENDRSFVWNDATQYHAIPNFDDPVLGGLSSSEPVDGDPVTGANTFSVSATGGVRFITGGASNPNVTYIPGDSAGWTTTSSRAVKTNIDPVDPENALAGVEELEVATWEYEREDGESASTTHIGPMAEDFHDAFDVGSSDQHINSINADGVALAAIQGLSAELDDAHEEIAQKDGRIDEQADRIDELEAENEQLRERLAAIEEHLGFDESDTSTQGVAND